VYRISDAQSGEDYGPDDFLPGFLGTAAEFVRRWAAGSPRTPGERYAAEVFLAQQARRAGDAPAQESPRRSLAV
jgi:hypothetical protein